MLSLFTNGSYSDVCIEFVASHFKANKIMKLHKHILCQSAYFQALLNSSWIDANQDIIKITITDKNITEKSVNSLLESFYTSNLKYDTSVEDLISLTATARMFDVDSIAKLCILELSNSISIKVSLF